MTFKKSEKVKAKKVLRYFYIFHTTKSILSVYCVNSQQSIIYNPIGWQHDLQGKETPYASLTKCLFYL